MKDKKLIAALCFLSDLFLSVWSYFQATNYEEYLKIVKSMVDSPDFQAQLYKVFLQTLTFSLLLFLSFHAIVYILFIKEKKYAIKYIHFYTAMAALSCLVMIFSKMFLAILPFGVYCYCFYLSKKNTPKPA